MLIELRVENLLLIERAELHLAPGLNVLTGETGAGKTMLAHALDLLLGGRPRGAVVRPGAREAYVEGVFEPPRGWAGALPEELRERLPPEAPELVLARRLGADGRSRAYVAGRAAAVGDLRAAAGALLSFYGQHEHRRLTVASAQLGVLDAFCGPEQAARLAACAAAHAAERAAAASVQELTGLAGARDRELDLLEWEIGEIEQAAPDEDEEEALLGERERLRHLEALRGGALAGAEAVGPESGAPGAAAMLAEAGRALDAARGIDADLDRLAERLASLRHELDDVSVELRRYAEALEAPPGRLEEVEDRLAALERLKRKHGGTLAAVLAHAESCRARRDELGRAETDLDDAAGRLSRARAELSRHAGALRAARAERAPRLAAAVRERLAELAMEGASFEVALSERAETGPAGADAVELMIAPNPGVPASPLRDSASGGELSRVMLALMGVASEGEERTLVFDEVDAGIGGQTARAVGDQLRALAGGRQVVCITHLPQIASLAARHFRIAKDVSAGTARTTVLELDPSEVVAELVRMLGADAGDLAARRHAQQLLRAAA